MTGITNSEYSQKIDSFKEVQFKKENLPKYQDVVVEAKRVLLYEQLEKIANITLSEINSTKQFEENRKLCKENIDWQNDVFWKDVENPKQKNEVKCRLNNHNKEKITLPILESQVVNVLNNKTVEKYGRSESQPDHNSGILLLKKYFNQWRRRINVRKERRRELERKIEQKEKLSQFIKNLKKNKKRKDINNDEEERPKSGLIDGKNVEMTIPKSAASYKNRFNAQKNIINMQKAKLEEQNKLIQELKLGIIREDLLKSIDNTKTDIREIFSICSSTVKSKHPHLELVEDREKMMVTTQKAPKIVQKMEQRAIERAQNREMILERKRILEEKRQRILEEAIENKRVLEEAEKKRNLEAIKEKRRQDLELEKIRQANKQKFLEKLQKADLFYKKLLMGQCFKKLFNYYQKMKENNLVAINHYERKIKLVVFNGWCNYIERKYKSKYLVADAFFAQRILSSCLRTWHNMYMDSVRSMQVAEDLYDFRLTSNTFIHWHRFVCKEIILRDKQMKIAEKHYNRRILFHYFYLWKSLPAVIQLEKAKEQKKRKWREKVWEILPDYKPPED